MALCRCLTLLIAGCAMAFADAVVDNPGPESFLRRAAHASIRLGDFVYIHGGQTSQLVDGVVSQGQGYANGTPTSPSSRSKSRSHCCQWSDRDLEQAGELMDASQDNVTLSIDLREPWTNATLLTKIVSKNGAPAFDKPRFWHKPEGRSFYLWAGAFHGLTNEDVAPPNALYEFDSDSEGGESWTRHQIEDSDIEATSTNSFFRIDGSGVAFVVGDVAHYIGGQVWWRSDPETNANPGHWHDRITALNMTSGQWTNRLGVGIGSSGTMLGGAVVSISALGLDERQLALFLGGCEGDRNVSAPMTKYYDFANVTLYDPYIDRWYAQHATGDVPPHRGQFCAVAVRGDHGTYEIFIYGGLNQVTWKTFDDMYILSIPGFVWFRVPRVDSPARFDHTCEYIGGSQMLSIGGVDNPQAGLNMWENWKMPDPFRQGIGVFDITELEWKSSFMPTEQEYRSPQMVREWYTAGLVSSSFFYMPPGSPDFRGQNAVEWQSLEIARMFIRDSPVKVSPTPAAAMDPGSGSDNGPTGSSGDRDNLALQLGLGLGLGIPSLAITVFTAWTAWRQLLSSRGRLVQATFEENEESGGPITAPIADEVAQSSNVVASDPVASSMSSLS